MSHDTDLETVLQEHLGWNRARIGFIVAFTMALIKVTTVNLTNVANALSGTALKESNYRRIQRFFAGFPFDYTAWGHLVLRLVPIDGDFVISIDRTNWRFGAVDINILMAGLVYQGTAYPLVWMLLPKRGNSNTAERKELIARLLALVPAPLISAVVADREFIGQAWLKALDEAGLPYYIRIRQNARVSYRGRTCQAKTLFRDLSVGQTRQLRKPRQVYRNEVFVTGMRLEQEYVIVVSNRPGRQALEYYRLRWGIEVLFAALKTRGFNFEETHLTDPERIGKLVALLALAFTWAHRVGEWVAQAKPLAIKNHGRRARSLFRRGLDQLQYVLLNLAHQAEAFAECLWVLIAPLCTLEEAPS
ncbi:MAG: IS4 family transposase [Bacteroidetes bacterium]|jgi:hypothetical protein|nr:IS4 family transposase [Bacteroidota bacterium]